MRAHSRAETTPWEPSRGERFGPYEVHEELGGGGLSVVHRAIDTRLTGPHELALKRLRDGLSGRWELVDAFLYEAQLASQLRHPHVARVYAYGKLDGQFYAAVELVRGATLAQIVRQSRAAAGAIPVGIVVELMLQLCDALDHLHTSEPAIVHRGVAPANLMVGRDGRLKLIDFGIASTAARRQIGRGATKDALAYVAPEAVFGKVDARGDLFAAGVIAHELLSSRPLFHGASEAATVHNVCTRIVPPPSRFAPSVSRELDDIVLTALQRDPGARWQSAAAMRFALGEIARELGGRTQLAAQVAEWLEWAFARRPRRDRTRIVKMIDAIEQAYDD
ncbi:MAG: serine/threonine-protein kinase [Acidobacteriota bacterium]